MRNHLFLFITVYTYGFFPFVTFHYIYQNKKSALGLPCHDISLCSTYSVTTGACACSLSFPIVAFPMRNLSSILSQVHISSFFSPSLFLSLPTSQPSVTEWSCSLFCRSGWELHQEPARSADLCEQHLVYKPPGSVWVEGCFSTSVIENSSHSWG